MNIQTDVQALLQKKMDRREFIKHVGIGFAALLGVSAVLRTMSSLGSDKQTVGYSGGVYGGTTSTSQQPTKQG